jgi:hypothetical protein
VTLVLSNARIGALLPLAYRLPAMAAARNPSKVSAGNRLCSDLFAVNAEFTCRRARASGVGQEVPTEWLLRYLRP